MTQQRPTNVAVEFLANAKKKRWTNLRDHIIRDHPDWREEVKQFSNSPFRQGPIVTKKVKKYLSQLGYHGQS